MSNYRVRFIIFVLISVALALLVRVYYLAVESNSLYSKLSLKNTIKTELIAPVRGEIVDRNNNPIAINQLGFKIALKPHLSSKKYQKVLNDEIDNLIKLFPQLNKEKILKRYKRKDSFYNHEYIDIVDFIPYKEMMPYYTQLQLRDTIKVIPSPKRFYPYHEIASHVIGYVAKANKKDVEEDALIKLIGYTGKNGIEKYYNRFLEGEAGKRIIQVNANNEIIKELSYTPPKENRKLTLTIDIELQKYIAKLFKGKAGAVVVMKTDGSILAASSFPEYNLNTFVSGISQKEWLKLVNSLDKPFTNKLVNGLYPPGSTIKTGLGLIYITTKLYPSWSVFCTAKMPLGKRVFRCWKHVGHGKTNITKAIRESCDDYFYKGSLQVGINIMSKGLKRMGLGKKTGIDLPNEFIGTVPSREWKMRKYGQPWYMGETVNTSIGQGNMLVTPIQIATFTALMATGKLPKPHFAKLLDDKEVQPEYKDVLTPKEKRYLPIIRHAMMQVCNYPTGTATHYLHSKVQIAGKTGTAQVIGIKQDIEKRQLEHELEYYSRSHAWFTTYGPYRHPQVIVTVLVEHGGHGGHAAGGIVSDIYNWLLEHHYISKR